MTSRYQAIIPGIEPADEYKAVTAPFNQETIAHIGVSDETHVAKALDNAQALFVDKANWLSTVERLKILEKLAQLMRNQAETLAQQAAREGGKPLLDSRVEVARAIEGIELCMVCLRNNKGEEIPMGLNPASQNKIAFTHKEPIGIVVAVSAFNHPLNLIVHQVAPAIAVGCPVIVKPASSTPISCFNFVKLALEAGLPPGWVQCLLPTNNKITEQLVTDTRVAFFSFIGSGAVGWMLRSKLAPGVRCALEHGGVAPVIVDKSPDFANLIPKLTKGGFYHAGQVCVSVQRIYVHEDDAEAVATRLAEQAKQLVVGDPNDEHTQVGPLISHKEVERVDAWVKTAVASGAQLIFGGAKISPSLYQPTVLLNPPDNAEVSTKEIFGPVVCVYTYQDAEDAINRANALDFAFQASIFSNRLDFALKAYRLLDASAIMVNEHTAFRADWMPFAGLKQSGYGVGGIGHTMDDMQIEKMLVLDTQSVSF